MKKSFITLVVFLIILSVSITGCTSPAPSASPATPPATTPVSQPAAQITTTAAPIQTITTTATTAAPTTDPILHRWVRQYSDNQGKPVGYEFMFYPEGTATYRYGTTTMISSNIMIVPQIEASGTWTKLSENKYLVKFLPTAMSGAQIVREYTLVPAHEETGYPGVVIKDHIESSFERDAIKIGQERSGEMYYPERAKIDSGSGTGGNVASTVYQHETSL